MKLVHTAQYKININEPNKINCDLRLLVNRVIKFLFSNCPAVFTCVTTLRENGPYQGK